MGQSLALLGGSEDLVSRKKSRVINALIGILIGDMVLITQKKITLTKSPDPPSRVYGD